MMPSASATVLLMRSSSSSASSGSCNSWNLAVSSSVGLALVSAAVYSALALARQPLATSAAAARFFVACARSWLCSSSFALSTRASSFSSALASDSGARSIRMAARSVSRAALFSAVATAFFWCAAASVSSRVISEAPSLARRSASSDVFLAAMPFSRSLRFWSSLRSSFCSPSRRFCRSCGAQGWVTRQSSAGAPRPRARGTHVQALLHFVARALSLGARRLQLSHLGLARLHLGRQLGGGGAAHRLGEQLRGARRHNARVPHRRVVVAL